jgi:hypothetical protein
MKNYDSNTDNVPSNSTSFSLNKTIQSATTVSNTEQWFNELLKIKQCPQREDALEFQLRDLCLVADKLGLNYASSFIKNYYELKIK